MARRFRSNSCSKWKPLFDFHFVRVTGRSLDYCLSFPSSVKRWTRLAPFHKCVIVAWKKFGGGVTDDRRIALRASTCTPLAVESITCKSTYQVGLLMQRSPPHCESKFQPLYGTLYWSETWKQIHEVPFDRRVIDLNWKIAHGILYTGSRLAHGFGMANVEARCFCQAADETLEHLFFECSFAQLLVNWVYFLLVSTQPGEPSFTVTDLMFGLSPARRKSVPKVIAWMLMVVKHRIWVARCDFRFLAIPPVEANALKSVIASIKFQLNLAARKCRTPRQRTTFRKDWLAGGTLGVFNGEKLVFSF